MPTPTSSNRLVTAVLSVLQTDLVTAAATQELPAVTEFLPYQPGLPDLTKAPQVWVDLQRINRGDLAAFGGANAKQARNRVLLIGISAAGPDPAAAVATLRSYVDLCVAAMEAKQGMQNEALRVQFLDAHYSPNLAESVSSLFQEAVLVFSIPRWAALGQD